MVLGSIRELEGASSNAPPKIVLEALPLARQILAGADRVPAS